MFGALSIRVELYHPATIDVRSGAPTCTSVSGQSSLSFKGGVLGGSWGMTARSSTAVSVESIGHPKPRKRRL